MPPDEPKGCNAVLPSLGLWLALLAAALAAFSAFFFSYAARLFSFTLLARSDS